MTNLTKKIYLQAAQTAQEASQSLPEGEWIPSGHGSWTPTPAVNARFNGTYQAALRYLWEAGVETMLAHEAAMQIAHNFISAPK